MIRTEKPLVEGERQVRIGILAQFGNKGGYSTSAPGLIYFASRMGSKVYCAFNFDTQSSETTNQKC